MAPLDDKYSGKLNELVTIRSATDAYTVQHDGNLVLIWQAENDDDLDRDQVLLSVHLGTGTEDSPRFEIEGHFPVGMDLTIGDLRYTILNFVPFVSIHDQYFASVDANGATFRLNRDVGNAGPTQNLSTCASVIAQVDRPFDGIPAGDAYVDVRPEFEEPDGTRTLVKHRDRQAWAKHLDMDMKPLLGGGKDFGAQEVRNTWLVSDPAIKPGDILQNIFCDGLVIGVQPVPRSALKQVTTSEEVTILARKTQRAILQQV